MRIVHYQEFNETVRAQYGLDEYNVVISEDWDNDTCIDFSGITGDLTDFDLEEIELLKKGDVDYKAYLIFEDLCRQGVIEPGDYLLEIRW